MGPVTTGYGAAMAAKSFGSTAAGRSPMGHRAGPKLLHAAAVTGYHADQEAHHAEQENHHIAASAAAREEGRHPEAAAHSALAAYHGGMSRYHASRGSETPAMPSPYAHVVGEGGP